jgi:hypothetical protein
MVMVMVVITERSDYGTQSIDDYYGKDMEEPIHQYIQQLHC